MGIHKFEDIISWQKSRVLVISVYKRFEKHKDFGFKIKLKEQLYL